MKYFDSLGLAAFPAAIPFKREPITIGTAALVGGMGLGSSILGAMSQKSSNKSYLKGVRETNEMNYKIAQETNDLNRELYQKNVNDNRINAAMQNAYDSPTSKLARLRQAGINAYETGNGVQIQSASPSPAESVRMQAPEQTPNPYGNMNFTGIAKDVIQSYQDMQQVQSSKYDLYIKGVDAQYHLEHELNRISLEQEQLVAAGLENESNRKRFEMLQIEAKQYESQLDLQREVNSETAKNLRVTRKQMRSQIIRDDKLAAASMAHMSKQDAIEWYNAHSSRIMARSQQKRVNDMADEMWNNFSIALQDSNDRHDAYQYAKNMRNWYMSLNAEERQFAREMMLYNIQHAKISNQDWYNKANSPVRKFMESTFGFNLDEILSGSASYSLGGVKPQEK